MVCNITIIDIHTLHRIAILSNLEIVEIKIVKDFSDFYLLHRTKNRARMCICCSTCTSRYCIQELEKVQNSMYSLIIGS